MLSRVVRLRPVQFDWRISEYPEYHFGLGRNTGLLAQDVAKIFPEMVSVDDRDYELGNYSEHPYLMLQAIKDLKAENDDLKRRLQAIESKLGVHGERIPIGATRDCLVI